MKKILTVGSAMLDIFLALDKETLPCLEEEESHQHFMLLEVGRKVEVPTIQRCSGGGATNAAVSFSRQGFDVQSFFKIGNDCEGIFIKEQLAQHNVDTKLSITSHTLSTGLSLIFPCPQGDRTTLTYRGASITLSNKEIPLDALSSIDCLYVTSMSGSTAALLYPLVKKAHELGVFVACNPGSSQLRSGALELQKALPFIDVLIMNSDEALECFKAFLSTGLPSKPIAYEPSGPELLSHPFIRDNVPFDLRHYFNEVLKRGPKIAVVTNGKEGVYVAQGTTLLFHPSLPADVVNTLGAGDAFGSGFIGALLQNVSIEQALIQGLVQATAVISVLDAQSGLLSTDELKKQTAQISMNKLQSFAL